MHDLAIAFGAAVLLLFALILRLLWFCCRDRAGERIERSLSEVANERGMAK
jgi:hypothetical protein